MLLHPSFQVLCLLLIPALGPPAQDSARLPGQAPDLDAVQAALLREAPASDNWEAEEWATAGRSTLEALVDAAQGGKPTPPLATNLRATALRPASLDWEQRGLLRHARSGLAPSDELKEVGETELLQYVQDWRTLAGSKAHHIHWHVERARLTPQWLELRVHVECSSGARSVQGEWRARFAREDPLPQQARLMELERLSFHIIERHQPQFVDDTERAFGGRILQEQLNHGIDHWRRSIDPAFGLGLLGHHGLAVGDLNGDGLEDVYLCQPGGLPNRLYLGGGRPAPEVAASAGLDVLDATSSALILDLDGDGDQDLALVLHQQLVVFENPGGGRFREAARHPAPSSMSVAAADTDLDGDVDLFLCGYSSPYNGDALPAPYYDATNGQANVFLRNEGDLRFVDATQASGLAVESERYSFAASFEDLDRDGDPDLYVANDFGGNALYINAGDGVFTERAEAFGVRDIAAGMGVTWADFNGDGWSDLYVSNMFSSAGGRITGQEQFQAEAQQDVRGLFQRHSRGNSLFLSEEGKGFRDVTESSGAAAAGWAWGGLAVDLTSNGRPDLVVPNGFVSGEAGGPDL